MNPQSSAIYRPAGSAADSAGIAAAAEAEAARLFGERCKSAVLTGFAGLAIIAVAAAFHANGIWLVPILALRVAVMAYVYRHGELLVRRIAAEEPFGGELARLETGMLVSGATWGLILWPAGGVHLADMAGLIIVITSLAAVGILVFSSAIVPRAMRLALAGYAPFAFVPLVLGIAKIGPVPLLGSAAFVAAMAFFGRSICRSGRAAIGAQIENRLLARSLSEANARLARALETAERLSAEDSLTGLLNRRAFAHRASQLAGAPGAGGQAYLMLVDLDHFKSINDRFGHDIGDEALQAAADVLAEICGRDAVCARWGGEEFLVALPDGEVDGIAALAERVRGAIGGIAHPGWPGALRLSASIGLARWHAGSGFDEAVAAADDAMYEAKQDGRDRVRLAPGLRRRCD